MLKSNLNQIAPYIFGNVLYLFSAIIPKSNYIWVFGSWGGYEYADNPKYLYEYVISKEGAIKAIWLTRSDKVYNLLKNKGQRVYYIKSIRGFWFSCRAKVGIISHGMIDINRFACARMEIVQTWHGIPMKPVLLSDPKENAIKKRTLLKRLSIVLPFLKKELNFDSHLLICSTSAYATNILKKVFGEYSPITETGFPRLDGIFNVQPTSKIGEEVKKLRDNGVKVGIYMPTYRRHGEFNIINYLTNNIEAINKALVDNHHVIYLKIHPFDFHKLPQDFSFQGLRLLRNEEVNNDIYSVLGCFDFLITDYSSIVFDYLILPRPVYFLDPDRENYISTNGKLVYDYRDMGLPCFSTWYELILGISQSFPLDEYRLNEISNKFHKHRNAYSAKRLFEKIIANL